ncbi:hypothetical protein [Lysinibacillus sp. fls2-241-R2A-57]|uniref:hypothetical protein n=1 Tax=Lysinibacillus sp. fls2-241-R2A-57 TaxID=3040292 RepID=UPI002555BB1A|nr:hypothetical protein [Lysinibacillus sp. fls2-241-R2A-57]
MTSNVLSVRQRQQMFSVAKAKRQLQIFCLCERVATATKRPVGTEINHSFCRGALLYVFQQREMPSNIRMEGIDNLTTGDENNLAVFPVFYAHESLAHLLVAANMS